MIKESNMKVITKDVIINNTLSFQCLGVEEMSNEELNGIKDKLRTFITDLEHELRSVGEIENLKNDISEFAKVYPCDINKQIIVKPTDCFSVPDTELNGEYDKTRFTVTYVCDLNQFVNMKITPYVETIIEIKKYRFE